MTQRGVLPVAWLHVDVTDGTSTSRCFKEQHLNVKETSGKEAQEEQPSSFNQTSITQPNTYDFKRWTIANETTRVLRHVLCSRFYFTKNDQCILGR